MPAAVIGSSTFSAPSPIVFGWGRRAELPTLVRGVGQHVWLVTGSRTLAEQGIFTTLAAQLQAEGLTVAISSGPGSEPTVNDVDRLVSEWSQRPRPPGTVVVAIGGGSTIDLAKAAAALITQPQPRSVIDYLEGVGCGARLTVDPLPMIALPTTAGTGAEATKNAVISSNPRTNGDGLRAVAVPCQRSNEAAAAETSREPIPASAAAGPTLIGLPFKKSLRHERMLPRAVIVDPELTASVPPSVTAATGMDALTQLIESYISRRSAPLPRALTMAALPGAWSALPRVVREGQDRPGREALAQAALWSGMALANSGLGIAHGVAAALGVLADVPHGLACAVMLSTAVRVNAAARTDDLATLAMLCLNRSHSTPAATIAAWADAIDELCIELKIPRTLRALGVSQEQLPGLVAAAHGNSLSGNPRPIDDAELLEILSALW